MFKITRHSDYAIVLLTHMAREAEKNVCTARDLAAEAQLPRPTVSKILKVLARKNLLTSHRGSKGGLQPRPSARADHTTGRPHGHGGASRDHGMPGGCRLHLQAGADVPHSQ